MPLRGPHCSLLCSEAREDVFISDSNRVRELSWDRGKPGATGWRGAHDASPENWSPTDGGGRAGGGVGQLQDGLAHPVYRALFLCCYYISSTLVPRH